MKSFLPWPGSKSRIRSQILELFPKSVNVYHEPFLGSGAIFFGLEEAGITFKAARLSDSNKDLIHCWGTLQENPEWVASQAEAHCLRDSEEYYAKTKQFMGLPGAFIYCMRAGFSSIYRVNKAGEFNVPWRKSDYEKGKRISTDTKQILQCGEYLNSVPVTLSCQIFQDAFTSVGSGDLLYLDPPYLPYIPTGFVGYTKDGFGWDTHLQLKESIDSAVARGATVVLSNSFTSASTEIFGSPLKVIGCADMAKSTATTKGKRQEGIWVWKK